MYISSVCRNVEIQISSIILLIYFSYYVIYYIRLSVKSFSGSIQVFCANRQNVLMPMQCHDDASMFRQRCLNILCPR